MTLELKLVSAAANGDLKLVQKLTSQGVNIKEDALTMAATQGHFEVVKCLVENGADIHVNRELPFHCAIVSNNLELVKYIVEQGTDISAFDNYALISAVLRNKIEIVRYFIEDCNVDIRPLETYTWKICREKELAYMAGYLASKGLNIDISKIFN